MNEAPLAPLQAELRTILAQGGCPLCRLARRAVETYIDALNYERVNDIQTRAGLDASRGLCPRHTAYWEHIQGSALGVAIVYRAAVHNLLRETESAAQGGRGWFGIRPAGVTGLAQRLESRGPCPACTIEAETARRYGEVLLRELGAPEVQEALVHAGGLCLPHLRVTLSLGGEGAASRLVAVQRQAWLALESELDEFIRKNDYRFRGEPMGSEADSWQRGAHALVGDLETP